mgnify:CR=1 FL=1
MQSDNREIAELSPAELAALPNQGQQPPSLSSPGPAAPPAKPAKKTDADVATPYQMLQAKLLETSAAARAIPKLLSLMRTLSAMPGKRARS